MNESINQTKDYLNIVGNIKGILSKLAYYETVLIPGGNDDRIMSKILLGRANLINALLELVKNDQLNWFKSDYPEIWAKIPEQIKEKIKNESEPNPDAQKEKDKTVNYKVPQIESLVDLQKLPKDEIEKLIKSNSQILVDLISFTKEEKYILKKLSEKEITPEIKEKYLITKKLSMKESSRLNETKCSKLLGIDVKTFKRYKPKIDNAISSSESGQN